MSAVGVSRAGYRPTGTASAAAAAGGASSKTGDGAGAGAAGAATATAVSVAEKEAERTVDVRAILKKKEDEVKEMLAPEKEMYEIDSLVVKIVDEVRALESKGGEQGAENSDYTFLAAVETAPQFHCPVCGNRQQTRFMLDAKQGDTICLGADGDGCGVVVQDHKVHEGSMYRKFEGEADRSHHGPAPNGLYSTAHNMRTWISEGKDANRLRNLAEDVEMGLSTVGKQDERKTRTAYKDRMKREAFDLINHIAGNCDLHETVTVRAKELFAGWRNVKEHVHQKHAVICACIIAAYREVGTEELSRIFDLRRQEGVEASEGRADPLYPFVCPECKAGFNAAKSLDFHQKEVHKSAAAAGKEVGGAGPPTQMSEWSLSDARGWLTSVVSGLGLPAEHVKSICTWLETSLGAQDKGQKVGRKRKATRTAGQYLMMLSLARCTELCGGGPEVVAAAGKLHHEMRRKSAERSREDKSRLASNHAAQRQNQNVRKPWVAHISAELDTASEQAQKAGAAAAAKETAAGATATAAAAAVTSAAAAVPPGAAAPAVALGVASAAPGAQAPGSAVASPAAAPAAAAGGGETTAWVPEGAVAVAAAGVQIAAPAQTAAGVTPLGVAVGAGDRSEPVEIDLVG